jgi:hypothetical protein
MIHRRAKREKKYPWLAENADYQRALAAHRSGEHCGRCGALLSADAPVWLDTIWVGSGENGRPVSLPQVPLCGACGPSQKYPARVARVPSSCGGCGRPVHLRWSARVVVPACSHACKSRMKAKEFPLRTCAHCAKAFRPKKEKSAY